MEAADSVLGSEDMLPLLLLPLISLDAIAAVRCVCWHWNRAATMIPAQWMLSPLFLGNTGLDIDAYLKSLTLTPDQLASVNRMADKLWRLGYKRAHVDSIAVNVETQTFRDYVRERLEDIWPPKSLPERILAKKELTARWVGAGSGGCHAHVYKLVMHKGNAVIEMRNRCSEFQRVLALLVLRLSIAETCQVTGTLELRAENMDAASTQELMAAIQRIMVQCNSSVIVEIAPNSVHLVQNNSGGSLSSGTQ